MKRTRIPIHVLILGCLLLGFTGCTDDPVTRPIPPDDEDNIRPDREETWEWDLPEPSEKDLTRIRQWGDTPPGEFTDIQYDGESLVCWPYTGSSYDGDPVDPVNLVFVGEADPVQIRAALLSLDGDRSAFGFPPVAPFDAIWVDAVGGDVQTTWAEDEGWLGSVIQLQLGDYAPLRVHLRLFDTGESFGSDGSWTLGGAHVEVMIPGTADHQVLSWEVAQQLVVADLARSGLLGAAPVSTGPINAAPSFRVIPAQIYNALPGELLAMLGGPAQPVSEDVPLASDGESTILHLTGTAPIVPGVFTTSVSLAYDQYVPRPFCMNGPYDWLYVTGPLDFDLSVTITGNGRYAYRGGYHGVLEATPIDISTGEPVGETFLAMVNGRQGGHHGPRSSRVLALDKRLTLESGGPQLHFTRLKWSDRGRKRYDAVTRCLDNE
jgi:hypothetical protein